MAPPNAHDIVILMFNLYRVSFVLALLVFLLPVQANVPFVQKVHQTVDSGLDDPKTGVLCGCLKGLAHSVWDKAKTEGFVVVTDKTDREARTCFTQIQLHSEHAMLNELKQGGKSKALWIIHTRLIATPLVTKGEGRPQLMRDYLKAGGTLVTIYDKAASNERTPEERAIFEELKKQYPKQLIDLPMDHFPLDKIGATYFFKDAQGHFFEMTNQGMQAHDKKDFATWGVWLQDKSQPKAVVTERFKTIKALLQEAKLNENLLVEFS